MCTPSKPNTLHIPRRSSSENPNSTSLSSLSFLQLHRKDLKAWLAREKPDIRRISPPHRESRWMREDGDFQFRGWLSRGGWWFRFLRVWRGWMSVFVRKFLSRRFAKFERWWWWSCVQTPSLREIRNFFLIQLFRSGVLERKMRGGGISIDACFR